jgi:hypothetical protein
LERLLQTVTERVQEMSERLAVVEHKLDDLVLGLFGDGQQGECEKHRARLRVLEHWRTAVCAIVGAALLLIGLGWGGVVADVALRR